MKIVWQREKGVTVRDVYEALLEHRKVAYTTVMTMMNILEQKKYLKKTQIGPRLPVPPVAAAAPGDRRHGPRIRQPRLQRLGRAAAGAPGGRAQPDARGPGRDRAAAEEVVNYQLLWNNLVLYSLQIGLLVGVAALVPAVLRLRVPRARLAYWHILLAACLLLPLVRPWRRELVAGDVQISSHILLRTARLPPRRAACRGARSPCCCWPPAPPARLAWLGTGFWKLRRYRRHARPVDLATPWPTRARLLVSEDATSPVTFGWRRPVVLLPARFPEFDGARATGHSVPRTAARGAARLAVRHRGRAGACGLLVSPGHLVAAGRDSTGA